MSKRPVLAAVALLVTSPWLLVAPGARASAGRTGGGPTAAVAGDRVVLSDGFVTREWQVTPGLLGGYDTVHLVDGSGRDWARGPSPDFELTVNGVPLSSAQGWSVQVQTGTVHGTAWTTFDLTSLAGLEMTRTYTLHPGSATIEEESTLANNGPDAVRVGRYTLDELTSSAGGTAEVAAYRGGSDWQDGFRTVSTEAGAFDDEGEVARFDDGSGAGWFFVTERRGGPMSRVGRDVAGDGWRTWAGVDPARDLLDLGPITTPITDGDRVPNPAYPAPIRQRFVGPFSTLALGRAYTGVYHGGAQEAARAFSGDFLRFDRPGFDSIDQNTFHPFGHAMTDARLRPTAAAAAALGVETFMLDDQWQGSSSGDWHWDPSRFPGGTPVNHDTPDFVRYLDSLGLDLGLWMSPLEFNPSSQTYRAHPDWACAPTGDASAQIPDDAGLGVWDVTNPAFRDYLRGVIHRMIADWHVRELKFDFLTWVDCPPHDYFDYEDAFVAFVHGLEAAHPNVTFEIDETNDQRSYPFESVAMGPSWFDNDHTHGSTVVAKQLHDLWSAAPWIPPSSLGLGAYDGTLQLPYSARYLMAIAMLSHVTFWTDLSNLSPPDAAETAWWLSFYRAHRGDLTGFVYEDTSADPLDGTSWTALQPWSGGHGFLFVFDQSSGGTGSIRLQGLDPTATYQLTDVRTGTVLGQESGAALESRLDVTLPQPYSALVLQIDPASA